MKTINKRRLSQYTFLLLLSSFLITGVIGCKKESDLIPLCGTANESHLSDSLKIQK